MDSTHLSTVGVMGNEDPAINDEIEMAAFMLPRTTASKLRAYATSVDESQNRVVAAAIEQYIAARKA